MKIVFDDMKRMANLKKHGLDIADFEGGFDVNEAIRSPARPSRTGRLRFRLVGRLWGEFVVVSILSPLGSEALPPVSLRSANTKERDLYGFR